MTLNAKKNNHYKVHYNGTNRLSPKELGKHDKEKKCFWCGTIEHSYKTCPLCKPPNKKAKLSFTTDDFDTSNLSYAWGKICD